MPRAGLGEHAGTAVGPVANSLRDRIGHRLLVAVAIAILVLTTSVVPLSRPASAGWTPDKCDIEVKYWCYAVFY